MSLQQIAFTQHIANLLNGTTETLIWEEQFLKKAFAELQQYSIETNHEHSIQIYKIIFMRKLKQFYNFIRSIQSIYSQFAIDILELNMMNHIIHTVDCIKVVMASFRNTCIILNRNKPDDKTNIIL
jgi:hypothetical protein